jgi:hypothetical protein
VEYGWNHPTTASGPLGRYKVSPDDHCSVFFRRCAYGSQKHRQLHDLGSRSIDFCPMLCNPGGACTKCGRPHEISVTGPETSQLERRDRPAAGRAIWQFVDEGAISAESSSPSWRFLVSAFLAGPGLRAFEESVGGHPGQPPLSQTRRDPRHWLTPATPPAGPRPEIAPIPSDTGAQGLRGPLC